MPGKKHVVDCSTGISQVVDLSPEEQAAADAARSAPDTFASAQKTRADAAAVVKAKAATDPTFAALAQLLGI